MRSMESSMQKIVVENKITACCVLLYKVALGLCVLFNSEASLNQWISDFRI